MTGRPQVALLQRLDSAGALVDAGLVSRESSRRLQDYVGLLRRWQQRINLIGPASEAEIWSRHVADSLQLLTLIGPAACILDLGSGAGFPGLPLAIALRERGDDSFVHLVEASAKKAAFLREAARLSGTTVAVHHGRSESIDSDTLQPRPTVVTARAVAPLPKLLPMALKFLQKGAVGLFLKGQDVDSELTETSKYWRLRTERIPSAYADGGVILKVEEVSRDRGSP
jgi:16S rRNA (guanine527-N7)-methyltransferase